MDNCPPHNLAHRVQTLEATQARLVDVVEKLVRIEERQSNQTDQLERLFAKIEQIDQRVRHIELSSGFNSRVTAWIERAGVVVAAGLVMFFINKLLP